MHFPQLLETNLLSETSFLGPTGIYLFKFSNDNSRIKCEIGSKLTFEAPDLVLVSLLLTLNVFDILL